MKLYRVILPVSDIGLAVSFYQNVLEKSGERVSDGRHYFNLEGTILALYDPIADGDEIHQKWSFHENQYIYIATDQLDVLHKKLMQIPEVKSVDKEISNMPWGEKLFYAKDIFGNPICFVDRTTIFTGTSNK